MKCLGLLLVLLVSAFSHGVEVKGIYDSRIVVPNQSADVRKEAAKLGLAEVLQKVSGFALPENNPAVEKAMSIADQYLNQFSYAKIEVDELSQSVTVGSSWLKMRFEERSVQRIIKAAQMPRWGSNRPSVLVWVALDESGKRQVVSDGVASPVLVSLRTSAEQRGLPIILPVNDLEDAMKLPVGQLWGLFSERIKQASQRYSAESILAGRVYKDQNGLWQGQWKFYFQDKEFNFLFESVTLDSQTLSALTESAQILANSFALKATNADDRLLNVRINGVSDLTDYANALAYLEKLAITQAVIVKQVHANELTLQLKLAGSLQQLKQALALDNKLVFIDSLQAEPEIAATQESQVDAMHNMKWRP